MENINSTKRLSTFSRILMGLANKGISFMLIPFFILCINACSPPVTFDEPQPTDTKALSAFPKSLQGAYQSFEDNSELKITDYSIIRNYDTEFEIPLIELDSTYQMKGDTLIFSGLRVPFKKSNDTIRAQLHTAETLFMLSNQQILKKFKGHFFLNTYDKDGDYWEVKMLDYADGVLSIHSLNSTEDLVQLREVTEDQNDSSKHHFKPTKLEFKKFVKANGFRLQERFGKKN